MTTEIQIPKINLIAHNVVDENNPKLFNSDVYWDCVKNRMDSKNSDVDYILEDENGEITIMLIANKLVRPYLESRENHLDEIIELIKQEKSQHGELNIQKLICQIAA